MTTRTIVRPGQTQHRQKLESLYADLLAIAVAFGASFYVHFVGELFIADILLLLLVPTLMALFPRRVFRPGLNIFLVLIGLWLFGQMVTDYYRGSRTSDWMRGEANIAFLAIDLAGLALLLTRNDRRKVMFLAAYAIGSILGNRFEPTIDISGDPWKWGYSTGVNIGVVLISCYFFRRRNYVITGLILAGITTVNLIENYRSEVLFLLITTVLVVPVIPERIGRLRLLPRAGAVSRVLVMAALALTASLAADGLVHWATGAGLLGEEAQAKNEGEFQAAPGLLLGGRPEILVSARAVMDSPILGHGSYARDFKYIEMLTDLETRMGFPPTENVWDQEEDEEGGIPAHSHLMSAWVHAGVLGALIWFYLWPLTLKGVLKVAISRHPLTPIYVYMLIGLLWDILFSPIGAQVRVTTSFLIIVLVDIMEQAASRSKVSRWSRRTAWKRYSASTAPQLRQRASR